MPDARTTYDSLGFYLSDPNGLGGARADQEHWILEPVIEPGIPSLVIEQIGSGCGEGQCQIVAVGEDSLKFAAPGEELGAAVTVAANTSAVLTSDTATKWVRVYRDATYNAADLSGELRFASVKGVNNAVGMANETVAGGTRYGCVWIHNRSASEITGIEVSATGAYTVALETPALGLAEETTDDETAPAVTFGTSDTAASLAPGESLLLRFKRVLSTPTVDVFAEGAVTVEWVSAAVTYTETLAGLYGVSDPALAGYALFVGEDAEPDFDAAPAASGAVPLTAALAPSHTHNWVLRQVNEYGLSSLNTLSRAVTLDGSGGSTTTNLTDPEVISITSAPGGEVDIRLRYNGLADINPADYFRLYVGANVAINGDDPTPDPVTDTPQDFAIEVMGLARPDMEQIITIGPYGYGVPVSVIARVYSSAIDLESGSMTPHNVTVTTQGPVGMHQFAVAPGSKYGAGRTLNEGNVYYDAPTNAVGIRTLNGEVVLFGSEEAFRAAYGSETLFRTRFAVQTVAHSAAGAATPIEAISADEIYINVSLVRRAKIDFTAGIIEAASFSLGAARISLPVIGPVYVTGSETNIMLRNSLTGKWTPALRVDDAGHLTVYLPYKQEL